MSWLYGIFSVQAVSNRIGVIEVLVALLMALRPISARLSLIGSVGAIITFLLTREFSLHDAWCISVLKWISVVGWCWPILNQGSRPPRCISVDCCRSPQGVLVHPSFSLALT